MLSCVWLKDELRKIVESLLPMFKIVRVIVYMPDVRHVVFFEEGMNALADADQAVFVAAGDV